MRTLDIHPAFGFESFKRWDVAVHQRDEKLKKEGKNLRDAHHREGRDFRMSLNNSSKVAACIPGLHLISAIVRMILCAKDKSRDPEKRAINARHIGRGIAEFFFLGPFLLLVDISQTILDQKLVEEYSRLFPDHANDPKKLVF